MFTASVLAHRGGFLFILISEKVPDRYAKVLGDFVGCFCVKGFLAAGLQVGQDAAADAYC